MPRLSPLIIACLLTACTASTRFGEPPASAAVPCALPVLLPDHGLSDQQIEIYWGRDRAELRRCGGKVDILAGRSVPALAVD